MLSKCPAKDPANNAGKKESNVIERAALLEQQPEQKSTNWVSLEQKIEQRVLLV